MAKKKEKESPSGHHALYMRVIRLENIVGRERHDHPRTKVWKDLEEITQEIRDIQQNWFRSKS
jgi:regulator of sigma D